MNISELFVANLREDCDEFVTGTHKSNRLVELMGEQGKSAARYFVADPQTTNPISVEVPISYPGGRLVFADLCTDFPGAETLSDSFEKSGVGYARADLLVLRGADTRFAERIEASDEVRRNVPESQPVLCLIGNAEADRGPALVRPSWAPATSHEPTMAELRAVEMYGLLLGRNAIMEKTYTHYEVGSGAHVRRYIRLRNALESPRDCRRIIDWMLPSITEGSQVMIAHRGLGVLEAMLEARLGRKFKGTVEVHRLPRYDESETGNPHVPVSMEPNESRNQVILIGVDTRTSDPYAPGGEREKALNSYGYAGSTKLCLVDTTFPEPATEAFVHVPIKRHYASDCEYCDQPGKWDLHKIDADDEIPEPVTHRRTQVKVNRAGMRDDKDLWRIIEKTGAAAVHVEQRYEHPQTKEMRRHRAVDLDVGKLLGNSRFYASCLEQLTLAQPKDCLVLIPDHESASALKELAEAALPYPKTSVQVVSRLDPAGAVGPTLLGYERILLLDDMIASGSTMGWLTDRLKVYLGPPRFSEIDLRGFVILNCAPSNDELNTVRSNFTPGDAGEARFAWCEHVPLPHPDDQCPWCDELKRLEAPMPSEVDDIHSNYFASRIADLHEKPLRKLSPVASATGELSGTFIGNISPATAFVRWASALQAKRAEVQIPGEGHPPSYYIDAGFVAAQWRDWAQCGGILRTASESELRYTSQERSFEMKWQAKSSGMELAKLAEFGWAAVEEKLTAPSASLVMQTLEERAAEDPAIAALAAILAARGLRTS